MSQKCTLGEEKKEHHSLAAISLPKFTRTKVLTLCLQAAHMNQPRSSGSHRRGCVHMKLDGAPVKAAGALVNWLSQPIKV